MSGLMLAAVTAGAVVACAFPALLLVFGLMLMRARRKGELAVPASQAGNRLLGTGLVGLALYVLAELSRLPALAWAVIGLLVLSAVICGWLLRQPLSRPLRIVCWALFANALFTAAFGSFALWLAGEAARIEAYNNPNEAEVRAALAKNPNDAAAHSSLAHIDMTRGDHPGEVSEWQQVLRVEPDNLDALLLLGGELSHDGKIDEARPIFQRLAARDDKFSVNARNWLARHPAR